MVTELESCGCYVTRYKGREVHDTNRANGIATMYGILVGEIVDPENIPL